MSAEKQVRRKGIYTKPKEHGVGFVACYRGVDIAFAADFDELVSKPKVKSRLGQQDLIIKHIIPEGMIAVY